MHKGKKEEEKGSNTKRQKKNTEKRKEIKTHTKQNSSLM
jgi:hypothetical protein